MVRGITASLAFCYSMFCVIALLDPRDLIPENINEICRSTNVCPKPNDTTQEGSFAGRKRTSCCTDCSCASDCGLRDQCCFPEYGDRTKSNRNNQQCMFLTSKPPSKDKQHLHRSYYTVTEAPPDGCVANTKSTTSQDNQIPTSDSHTEAPWGNLAPVSSRATGKIYKTKNLAECYGENDILTWNAELACDSFDHANSERLGLIAHAEALVGDFSSSHCRVDFMYPGNKADIMAYHCYNDVIETCGNSSFTIPEGIGLTIENIRTACTSGFFSPYFSLANYANVFCHICNGEYFTLTEKCSDPDSRTGISNTFTSLLHHYTRNICNGQNCNKANVDRPMACKSSKSAECRRMHCPSGQIDPYHNGTCIWPFTDKAPESFMISLILTPVRPFPVDAVESTLLSPKDEFKNPTWLLSPWPKSWEMNKVFYGTSSDARHFVNLFVVEQAITVSKGRLIDVLKMIDGYLKKKWRASVGNNSFEFEQNLSLSFVEFESNYKLLVHSDLSHTNLTYQNLKILYRNTQISTNPVDYITRLFFCNQVELEKHEYSLYVMSVMRKFKVLVLNSSQKKLLEAEYALVPDFQGHYNVRVCLADSGLTIYTSRSSLIPFKRVSLLVTLLSLWLRDVL